MLKASRSSPCLVLGKDDEEAGYTPVPERQAYDNYYQQSTATGIAATAGAGSPPMASPYYLGTGGGKAAVLVLLAEVERRG